MKLSEKVAVVVMVVLFLAAWGFAGEGYHEVVEQTHPLEAGGSVAVDNVNGDVTVEVWDRPEVRLHAVKSASSAELLDGLRVEVSTNGSSVRIHTEYPSSRGWSDDHDSRGTHTRVEYTLTVPRWALLEDIDLVNGNLHAIGVEGGIEASTINGNIVVREGAGSTDLETVNGGIEIWLDRLTGSDEVELAAVNGSIDLHLAASAAAELRAETVNGRLKNDFDIAVRKGRYVGASFAGSIGGGGARIGLETVNGSVSVHRW